MANVVAQLGSKNAAGNVAGSINHGFSATVLRGIARLSQRPLQQGGAAAIDDARLFFDPQYLKSVQRAHAHARGWRVGGRIVLAISLALLVMSWSGELRADDGAPAAAETTTGDGGSLWEWLVNILSGKEEGGSDDPEHGVGKK